ncbi:hypothetical protein D1227_15645 [Henriciella mobilis]|nr:hypothetical protein [Henriciella mobilis]RIJ14347.1 hypothetical protein D1231_16395 [Henriciella mobilis]RIJ19824.1 hypothetical protein D1227_15645 [Henriciella mobilis]
MHGLERGKAACAVQRPHDAERAERIMKGDGRVEVFREEKDRACHQADHAQESDHAGRVERRTVGKVIDAEQDGRDDRCCRNRQPGPVFKTAADRAGHHRPADHDFGHGDHKDLCIGVQDHDGVVRWCAAGHVEKQAGSERGRYEEHGTA